MSVCGVSALTVAVARDARCLARHTFSKSTPFGALHCKYTRVLTLRMSCQVANSHKLLPHKVLRYKVIRHKVIRGLVMAVWKGKGEGKGC